MNISRLYKLEQFHPDKLISPIGEGQGCSLENLIQLLKKPIVGITRASIDPKIYHLKHKRLDCYPLFKKGSHQVRYFLTF